MKTKSLNILALAAITLLTVGSLRAGTITMVNLPPTNTDIATGITTNKTYLCAFTFGNFASPPANINGVVFKHFALLGNNDMLSTNQVDNLAQPIFNVGNLGQVIVSCSNGVGNTLNVNPPFLGPEPIPVDQTQSSSQGAPANQADGNTRAMLEGLFYVGNGAPVGSWMLQEYDGLTIGHSYSLCIYYKFWSAAGDRLQNAWFDGEGTWQAYANNPFDEDAGTNGTLTVSHNPVLCHGARYIEYDFTATATNVYCLMTNIIGNGAFMLNGSTLQDDSDPYAPFVTYQASVAGIGNGAYQFGVNTIGTGPLTYQWYSNSVSSYVGATMTTDSPGVSGSVSNILTVTTNLLAYYYAVASNPYGSATSSIVQINPLPVILSQPSPTNMANSYVQYNAVGSSGFPPLTYQWYVSTNNGYTNGIITVDGQDYTGSVTTNLEATTNLQDYYFIVATDPYGSVTSSITSYNPLPIIASQPVASPAGSSIQFNVTASGWPTLAYQWYYNTVSNYSGATVSVDGSGVSGSQTASLTTPNLLDFYFVVVTNYYGSVTSLVTAAAVQLTVTSAGEPIWNQTSQTNIIVIFSDLVSPATAGASTNYLLNNGATVSSANVVGGSNEVVLTTSPLSGSYTLTVQNVKDASFGIKMSPSPTNLVVGLYPVNLALWIRANAANVTSDGSGGISQWNDLSGNNNILYGSGGNTEPADPILATNAWGDPVIRFTATNQTQMGTIPSSTLAILGNMSIVAVVNYASVAGNTNGLIVAKTGNGAQANIPAPYDYYVNASATTSLYRGNGGSGGDGVSYGQYTTSAGLPSIGVPHILAVTEMGNTVSHFVDGNLLGTGVLNGSFQETNDADPGNPLFIGMRSDTNNFLTGDLSELIVAASPISTYDVTQMTTHLAQVHNITFINSNPTNIMFSASGGNLTLSWPLDHTGWQLQAQTNSVSAGISTNWANVNGSTTTNQVVVPISLTSGCVFYRLIYAP